MNITKCVFVHFYLYPSTSFPNLHQELRAAAIVGDLLVVQAQLRASRCHIDAVDVIRVKVHKFI